eukprot:7351876-Pyramimonas_sp.AAC.1
MAVSQWSESACDHGSLRVARHLLQSLGSSAVVPRMRSPPRGFAAIAQRVMEHCLGHTRSRSH